MKPILRSSRPFSPALLALSGVVVGMCFVALALPFVQESWPEMMLPRVGTLSIATTTSANGTGGTSTVGTMGKPATTTEAFSSSSPEQVFKTLPLRFIRIIDGSDERYTYFVATDRAAIVKNGEGFKKQTNDSACGSVDTQANCYLFREGRSFYGADPFPTRIATWNGPGAFTADTNVKFTGSGQDASMEFTVKEGTADCGIQAKHKINLATGQDAVVTKNTCTQ